MYLGDYDCLTMHFDNVCLQRLFLGINTVSITSSNIPAATVRSVDSSSLNGNANQGLNLESIKSWLGQLKCFVGASPSDTNTAAEFIAKFAGNPPDVGRINQAFDAVVKNAESKQHQPA